MTHLFHFPHFCTMSADVYRGADKSLVRPASLCILFDGKNISFDASLVIYIKVKVSHNRPGWPKEFRVG